MEAEGNFAVPDVRLDKGALWENFLMTEHIKFNHYERRFVNSYFWRTHDKAEIDYIEEVDGILHAFEFKWKEKKTRFPSSFLQTHPDHCTTVISKANFESFLGVE